MTKKEIVRRVSDRVKLSQEQTKKIVDLTFDTIVDALVEEGRLELRNFGVFVVRTRKARVSRSPTAAEAGGRAAIVVGAKNVVKFQPGKAMEERVKGTPGAGGGGASAGPGRPLKPR